MKRITVPIFKKNHLAILEISSPQVAKNTVFRKTRLKLRVKCFQGKYQFYDDKNKLNVTNVQ